MKVARVITGKPIEIFQYHKIGRKCAGIHMNLTISTKSLRTINGHILRSNLLSWDYLANTNIPTCKHINILFDLYRWCYRKRLQIVIVDCHYVNKYSDAPANHVGVLSTLWWKKTWEWFDWISVVVSLETGTVYSNLSSSRPIPMVVSFVPFQCRLSGIGTSIFLVDSLRIDQEQ